jgi:hypothetical protein
MGARGLQGQRLKKVAPGCLSCPHRGAYFRNCQVPQQATGLDRSQSTGLWAFLLLMLPRESDEVNAEGSSRSTGFVACKYSRIALR